MGTSVHLKHAQTPDKKSSLHGQSWWTHTLSRSIYLPKRPATATTTLPSTLFISFHWTNSSTQSFSFLFWPKSPHRIQHHVKKSTINLNPSPFQKAVIDLIFWHFPWQADSHPIRSPPSLVPWVSDRSLQNCHQLPLSNQAPEGGHKMVNISQGEVAAFCFFFFGGGCRVWYIIGCFFVGNYWKLEIFLVLKKCKLHIFSGAEVTDVLNRTCWKSAIWDILPTRNTVEIDVRFQWWLYIDSLVALAIEDDKLQKRHGTMLHSISESGNHMQPLGIITSWDVWSSSILSMSSQTTLTANFFPPLRWWRTAFKASCYSLIFGNNAPIMCASWLSLRFAKKTGFINGWFDSTSPPSKLNACMRFVTTHMYLEWNRQAQKRPYPALVDPIWGLADFELCPYGLSLMKLSMLLALLPRWVIENVVLWRATNIRPSITILDC